jgi:uncharacterized Ntn-hydrolase superfamily protein
VIRPVATFSVVGVDLKTGDVGIAVASKFLACGAVVPWASAGAGAVATQSFANTAYGPDGLALMRSGLSAEATLAKLVAEDADRDLRQAGLVDTRGGSATFTGSGCHGWAGGEVGDGFAVQGNILAGPDVVAAMAAAYRAAAGSLAERLLAGLIAGDKAGGDKRGRQAAALYVARPEGGYLGKNDVLVDLRVDDHKDPVSELGRLLDIWDFYFGISAPEDRIAIEGPVLVELKQIMHRAGYYRGDVMPVWDEATAKALDAFSGTENFEERMNIKNRTIDAPVLAHLRRAFPAG